MRPRRRSLTVLSALGLSVVACSESPTEPVDEFVLTIAGDAQETRSRSIELTVDAPTAAEIRIAEGRIDTATFRPVTDTIEWTLSSGDGEKTVLGQVRFVSEALSPVVDVSVVLAEHVYASPTGTDDAPGSYLEPKGSITAAMATALEEGRGAVRLFGGTYSPSSTGDAFPIRPPDGMTIEWADTVRPVVNGEETGTVVVLEGVTGVSLRGLTLTGGSSSLGGGVHAIGASALLDDVRIRDNEAEVGSGLLVDAGSDVVLRRSVVARNRSADGADAHGIEVRAGSWATLHNNTIALHDSNGILIRDTSAADIRNNIIARNGQTDPSTRGRGICEVSDPHRTVLRYNLFFENVVAAVLLGGSGDLSASAANDASASDGIAVNFEADPLFVDAAALDFRIASGSPAIDAGDPNPAYRDADGSRNDIGHLGGR